MGTVGLGRVGLVCGHCGHCGRAGARPADRTGDADVVQDGDEVRAVGGLPRGEHEGQRQPGRVDPGMDFAAQPASGSAEPGSLCPGLTASPRGATILPRGRVRVVRAGCDLRRITRSTGGCYGSGAPFLGQRLLQRIQGLPGDRQPGRLLMRPHDRGVHADHLQPDLRCPEPSSRSWCRPMWLRLRTWCKGFLLTEQISLIKPTSCYSDKQ
jgi:hypothetical protein